jgi:predicted phosphoribosyltransferase
MFKNRKDAALQLARALEAYKDVGAVVLGIPRGGAETGYHVAKALHAKFSLLIARKLGHPGNPEYAMGAIAEDGSRYLNPQVSPQPSEETINAVAAEQQREIERRITFLRDGKPLPPLKDRIVILVDDGIATGSTLLAAIACCKHLNAQKIIVAAPVAATATVRQLNDLVDDVVILETPAFFSAVSQVYEFFPQLSDEEARGFWREEEGM